MGFNYRKKILLNQIVTKRCKNCQKIYSEENNFCQICGKALSSEKTQVFANIGKQGITSISYKLPDGTTINTKGNVTIPMGNGMSYTTKTSKKK